MAQWWRLLQSSPADAKRRGPEGKFAIIDLDLSKYDRLASRFGKEQTEARSFLKSGINTRNEDFNQLIEQIEHDWGSRIGDQRFATMCRSMQDLLDELDQQIRRDYVTPADE